MIEKERGLLSRLDRHLHIYRSLGASYAPLEALSVGGNMKKFGFVLLIVSLR